jgi:isopentenyl diphosphate isomerase/L-lactate dehydrogenase-like FMN-dependent dehydrogenase
MRLVHPDGDRAVARGAAALGTLAVVASMGGYTLEQIESSSNGPKWLQLYSFSDRRILNSLVERAVAADYGALVCTLDSPVMGNRERDYRNGFTGNMRIGLRTACRMGPQLISRPRWAWNYLRDGMPFEFPNAVVPGTGNGARLMSELAGSEDVSFGLTWDDLTWIRTVWPGPIVAKGLLTATDARRAVDAGVDGVIVSNHGGRQLDGVTSSLGALEAIVAAVGNEVEVLMDGGIRRGSDVAKAVALGARTVLVGRAAIWGLAVGGADGVARVLRILQTELARTVQLLGRPSLTALDRDCITWMPPRPQQ